MDKAKQAETIHQGSKLKMAYDSAAGKVILKSAEERVRMFLCDVLNPTVSEEDIRQRRQRILGLLEHIESDGSLIKAAVGFATKRALQVQAQAEED